ncbi:MAG: type 4a pilus biogenesis protein PilO [Gemmatimonadetes bacterium]|jgi:Tfp pilus assembly protein PilO|nr:type 4a pilus biogenesis protein PilO [Gemmatimonadota bacterium]MBP6442412.1 type 4a pilus biogenesis protein PilO [Gemmatimonadales bacterium]MBK7594047.1 type 4a pilus biogenesis protein PilO [Gemmatimonadota bacterium]MBK9548138.1 type 4a pilus biogenesis protein PilO [Gemmatimonadota bacterium]MBL0179342.1 type 4a pilus biogenesis protein PilO [Gemmatimonadota bacterium]
MADTPKTTPILLGLIALVVGYAGWSGDGLNLLGIEGLRARSAHAAALQDTLTGLEAQIDTAKRDLAKESVEDVKKRAAAFSSSLQILRALVPEQREVANLLDDIQIRAKVRGVNVADFTVLPTSEGPAPFDTYAYQMAVIGRYHQVGSFLTDVASLRRIMVSSDVKLAAADMARAKALGDTTAMIEARFTIRTYVKAKVDSTATEAPDAQ